MQRHTWRRWIHWWRPMVMTRKKFSTWRLLCNNGTEQLHCNNCTEELHCNNCTEQLHCKNCTEQLRCNNCTEELHCNNCTAQCTRLCTNTNILYTLKKVILCSSYSLNKKECLGLQQYCNNTSANADSNTYSQIVTILIEVDIEGSELTALPQWIESGALEKVTLIFTEANQPIVLDPGGATCYGASLAAHTPTKKVALSLNFLSLLKKSTVESSWTGFSGCWKCFSNCTPWDSVWLATKWTWRWINQSLACRKVHTHIYLFR